MSVARPSDVRLGLVLGLTLLLAVGLVAHVPYLNGPWYWDWPWRRIGFARIVPGMVLAAIPFAVAQWGYARGRWGVRGALCLVALSTFLLELVAIGVQGPGFDLRRIVLAVQSPVITSYFTDAMEFGSVGEGLAHYPERMAGFHLHSINKPPGPILYYVTWIRALGPALGALLGGLGIGLLGAAGVAGTYGLARRFGAGPDASFAAASYLALCPGLILFFPEFDQAYPLLCCGLLGAWSLALERRSRAAALAFGGLLWLLSFFSFGLLVIGVMCGGLALVEVRRSGPSALVRIAEAAGIAFGVVVLGYVLLGVWTGYDSIATFQTALVNQAAKAAELARPWPATIPFDLLDFALGTGWLSYLLVGFWFLRRWNEDPVWLSLDWRVVAGLVQIGVVAVWGLIPVETARVWLFMMPLLMLPVGIELAQWTARARGAVYFALWVLMVLVGQNMVFLGA
jgi:hypothetical protein